ncbi:MAG: hypothetical protein I8H77_08010 [Comamonadaceae bacterium]|nr:hypothetical protein [Comamonadaceae bacterium]
MFLSGMQRQNLAPYERFGQDGADAHVKWSGTYRTRGLKKHQPSNNAASKRNGVTPGE